MKDDILPDRLKSGMILKTHTGTIVEVVASSKRGGDGEPLVRLRFNSGIIGHRWWNRDELQAEGIVLISE